MGGEGKGKAWRRTAYLVYVVVAARVYLLRCYAKNVKTDLTAGEKKELQLIVADLKGVQ